MPDNSAEQMVDSFTKILKYANGSGSVNLYMAHGGTNFGFYAGDLPLPVHLHALVQTLSLNPVRHLAV